MMRHCCDPRHGAGRIDLISDGEIRHESYSSCLATALDGVNLDNPASLSTAPGTRTPRRLRRRLLRVPAAARSLGRGGNEVMRRLRPLRDGSQEAYGCQTELSNAA